MRMYSTIPRPIARIRGFTLIEIMVVVIIIGLLAAVIVPSVVGKVGEARVAKARQDIQAMGTDVHGFQQNLYGKPKYGTSIWLS